MTKVLNRSELLAAHSGPGWQRVVFTEFEATLTSRSRPFPCVYGVAGLRSDQLRFAFVDGVDGPSVAPILRTYLSGARSIGRMTSLVVFGRPGPVQSIETYRKRFWSLLDDLERLDDTARPADIPAEMDTEAWEFCFAGEPIFVVCNSPAHVLRQSRRSSSFMVTFQPRWVFEGITDSDDPAALKALATVRSRLAAYDAIETSPFLAKYGDPGSREFRQYFIDDTNDAPACPFHSLGSGRRDSQQEGRVA